jgi:hypothetical protein
MHHCIVFALAKSWSSLSPLGLYLWVMVAAINKHGDFRMTSAIKLALLAALGTAVLAAPVSAQSYQQRHGTYLSVSPTGASAKRARTLNDRVYLLENYGALSTNRAESFQNQFNIDY